jgi:hypothetical protein
VAGFSFDMLTGEASGEERMEMVDRFQDPEGDSFILLISTLAGGVGLNLTAVSEGVVMSRRSTDCPRQIKLSYLTLLGVRKDHW